MRNILFVLFLFLSSEGLYCQKKYTIDDIKNELNFLRISTDNNVSKLKKYEYLYQQSKEIGYSDGEIRSLLKSAIINYRLHQNFDQIISQAQKAESLAVKNQDLYSVSVAKAIRSGVLINFGLLEQGKKELDQGYKISDKIQDSELKYLAKLYCYQFYSAFYAYKKDYKQVIFWSKKILDKMSYSDNFFVEKKSLEIEALGVITSSYLQIEDFYNAEKFLKLTETNLQSVQDKYSLAIYFKNKADFINTAKKGEDITEISLKTYLDAEQNAINSKNFLLLDDIYPKIARLYEKKNDVSSQVYYLNKSNKIKDSLRIAETEAFDRIVSLNKESKTKKEDKSYYIIIIVFVAVCVALYLYFNQFIKKSKSSIHHHDVTSKEDLYRMALEDSASFIIFFMKRFPDFSDKIIAINPTMKNSDIEFLAFLKIGLNDRQIAQSKKSTMKAVAAKKYRIRMRLNISADEKLELWLNKL